MDSLPFVAPACNAVGLPSQVRARFTAAEVFETLHPGWTPDAWVAFTNSPANLSANRILSAAEELRDAIERHLAGHPLPLGLIPGWPRPGSHAEGVHRHFAGALYALGEFCDAVADFIPEPEQAQAAEGRAAA